MRYVYQNKLGYENGVGIVFGSFAPLHKGHLDLIYQAKKECLGGVMVVVCGYEGDKGYPLMSLETRYRLTRQFFLNDPLVSVYAISDDELGIAGRMDAWNIWFEELLKVMKENNCGESVSFDNVTFYVGEEEYERGLKDFNINVKLIDRSKNEARATNIRENPLKHWDEIAQSYQSIFSHNILITGTASEGKTTLTEDISRYFNIPHSHEWAHDYLRERSLGDWEFDTADFLTFLNGQFQHTRKCRESRENKGIFISDTDVIITKMYAKYYAQQGNMGISESDYYDIIEPVADAYAQREHWNKIFVLMPKGEFVDNHVRYMGHSSMLSRLAMIDILIEELNKAGYKENIVLLNKGYMENFEIVKEYIKNVMNGGGKV